jgi:flagellar basal-body rod protein FlgC
MGMNLIPGIQATSSALSAEKIRLDMVAQNIANANTTQDVNGEVYKRKEVVFESSLQRAENGTRYKGVKVVEIKDDDSQGIKVYRPGHPHADERGMVQMPNVEITREMIDMITASKSYEANLTVVRTARQMAQQALRIGY